jgi:uncharacterized protein
MTLRLQLNEDMKNALRARESERLGAIRLLLAAVRQREIDERVELDDAGVIAVVEKMLKQRRDSIAQFGAAGRDDLVSKERFEMSVLEGYMPQPLSPVEIDAILQEVLQTSQATSVKDMGKVMALLKPRLAGRADMAKVSVLLKGMLAP